MRDELLNETLFVSLDHARDATAWWVADYSSCRPHSALGYMPPSTRCVDPMQPNSPQWTIRSAHLKRCADRPLLHRRIRADLTAGLRLRVDEDWGSQHGLASSA